jgi:hypothetical protein
MEPLDPLKCKSLGMSTHVACACRSAIALRKLRTLQRGGVGTKEYVRQCSFTRCRTQCDVTVLSQLQTRDGDGQFKMLHVLTDNL